MLLRPQIRPRVPPPSRRGRARRSQIARCGCGRRWTRARATSMQTADRHACQDGHPWRAATTDTETGTGDQSYTWLMNNRQDEDTTRASPSTHTLLTHDRVSETHLTSSNMHTILNYQNAVPNCVSDTGTIQQVHTRPCTVRAKHVLKSQTALDTSQSQTRTPIWLEARYRRARKHRVRYTWLISNWAHF